VPTLRQLREKLDNSPASLFEHKRLASGNRYVRVDPYEDRQFVAASGQTNLADLTERTERETESDSGSTPGVLDPRTARLVLAVIDFNRTELICYEYPVAGQPQLLLSEIH
jgi:hypothetical protein